MKIAINGEILEVSGLPEGAVPVKPLTKAEYDALTDEERQADVVYAITDDAGSSSGSGGSSEEVYSTEETRIGTWIDGKPLYRKVVVGKISRALQEIAIGDISEDIDKVVNICATFTSGGGQYYPNSQTTTNASSSITSNSYVKVDAGRVVAYSSFSVVVNNDIVAIVEYTKTTDAGGAA